MNYPPAKAGGFSGENEIKFDSKSGNVSYYSSGIEIVNAMRPNRIGYHTGDNSSPADDSRCWSPDGESRSGGQTRSVKVGRCGRPDDRCMIHVVCRKYSDADGVG